ncbi:MAG: GAF domain-containing protein [Chloroflexota bacterium]
MQRSRRSTNPQSEGTAAGSSDTQWLEDSLGHVKELSDRVTELSTLMGVSTLLSSDRPLPEVLDAVCRLGAEICKSQVSFLHLADGEDDLVCVSRHCPGDALQYAWEGVARIYGRKSIQKGEMVHCSNLLLRREDQQSGPKKGGSMGGICAIPLKGKTRVVGTMEIGYSGTHRFSAREKDMLRAIAAQVAMAVERSWLIDQLQEQLARANSLREMSTQIGSHLEMDRVLDSAVNHASRLLAAEFSAVFLADQHHSGNPPQEGLGGERDRNHNRSVPLGDGALASAVQQAIETGRPAVALSPKPRSAVDSPADPKPADYRSALAVPLASDRDVLGVLTFCYLERLHFDETDISLAEAFARQTTLAVQNARLYEDAVEGRLSLETAIDQINNHGISLLDADLNMTFANPATFWMLGVGPRRGVMTLEEWTAHVRKGLADGGDVEEMVARLRANPEKTVIAKLTARGTGDSPRVIRLTSLPLRHADGSFSGRVNVLEDEA